MKFIRSTPAALVYTRQMGWANHVGQILEQEVHHACSVCVGECDA